MERKVRENCDEFNEYLKVEIAKVNSDWVLTAPEIRRLHNKAFQKVQDRFQRDYSVFKILLIQLFSEAWIESSMSKNANRC